MGALANKYAEILRTNISEIQSRYGVKNIGIFGSRLRDDHNESSDLDILVEFDRTVDYFEFLELEEYLSKLIGVPVDLVEKQALKPRIGSRILSEVVMI
jgi:uncharacterized protein